MADIFNVKLTQNSRHFWEFFYVQFHTDNPSKNMAFYPHVAISISKKGWSLSFWPEAEEQLIHDLFHGDSHSGLTQVTYQEDLVSVLASLPGTVQTPSVKGLLNQQQREAGAEFEMSHTGG